MIDGELAATIYGISYGTRHITENLAVQFQRKENDGFAIAMLHTDMGGEGSPYAPCSLDDLKRTKMDYWALGHVHTRKIVNQTPYVVYPGNTQGLDLTEVGPKGCYLVDVGAYGTVTLKFMETDAVRWLDMPIDISDYSDQEALLREIMRQRAALKELTGRPNIARLILRGRGPLHRAAASESGREFILQALNEKEQFRHIFTYFSRIKDETKPALDLKERRQLPDVMGDYLRAYDETVGLPAQQRAEQLRRIVEERPEMKKWPAVLALADDEMVARAFERAELLGAEWLAEEDTDENH